MVKSFYPPKLFKNMYLDEKQLHSNKTGTPFCYTVLCSKINSSARLLGTLGQSLIVQIGSSVFRVRLDRWVL